MIEVGEIIKIPSMQKRYISNIGFALIQDQNLLLDFYHAILRYENQYNIAEIQKILPLN